MTKVLVRLKLLHALVASGKGWQAGERYRGGTEGSVTSQDPRKEKPTGAEHRSGSAVKMGRCCNIHRRRLEPHHAQRRGSFCPSPPPQHEPLTFSGCWCIPPAAEVRLNH